MMKDLAWGQIL